MAVRVRAKVLNCANKESKIAALNTTPILAAKIFGPAFTGFGLKFRVLTRYFDKMANGLYAESSAERKKKSRSRKLIISTFDVNIYEIRNKTVNVALNRATRSFIFLSEIGQMA